MDNTSVMCECQCLEHRAGNISGNCWVNPPLRLGFKQRQEVATYHQAGHKIGDTVNCSYIKNGHNAGVVSKAGQGAGLAEELPMDNGVTG